MTGVVALRPEHPQQLVQYEQMRAAVERCATIDEAASIEDDITALAAYARQRDDVELQCWVSEIHLRAKQKCGELSARLAKANPKSTDPDTYKSKALADAGMSKNDASRMERLAGYNEHTRPKAKDTPAVLKERERLFAAGKQASEAYYSSARERGVPPSEAGLQLAVDTAIAIAAGKPPPRQPFVHPDKPLPEAARAMLTPEFKITNAAMQAVESLNTDFPDPAALAEQLYPKLRSRLIGELKIAIAKLQTALEAIDGP